MRMRMRMHMHMHVYIYNVSPLMIGPLVMISCSSAVITQDSAEMVSASAPTSASASASASASGDSGTETSSSGGDGSSGSSGGDPTEVVPGVDLAVVELAITPAAPALGDDVRITATVANLGTEDLQAQVRLGIAIGAQPRPELDLDVDGLGASDQIQATTKVAWAPGNVGATEVAAVIDADAVIDEADEENNYRELDVIVGEADAGECRSISAWSESATVVDDGHVSHPLPSFAHDGWFYVHTHKSGGGDRILYAAKPDAEGVLGPWQVASSDHGGGPHGFTAIDVGGDAFHFRNGHIARYKLSEGVMDGDVELVEDDVETAFGGNKYVWDSAAYVVLGGGSGYVVHLGGFSFNGYAYRPQVFRSAVPVGPAFTKAGLDHPQERPGKVAVYAPAGDAGVAYLYTGEGGGAGLWRGVVTESGDVSGWDVLVDLPVGTGNERGDLFIVGRSLFAVRGAAVFRAELGKGDGALGPWTPQASLPSEQVDINWGEGHLEGPAYGIIGDHVHLMGPTRVFSARLEPTPCAE